MRRLLIPILLALALSGCGGKSIFPTLDISTTVSLNTVLGVEAAYGTVLSAERTYKRLCATKAIPDTCRAVVVRLQAADLKAIQAISAAVTFIKNYPTVDASNVIGAAHSAIDQIRAILAPTGVI